MSVSLEDNLTLNEIIQICKKVKQENIEVIRDNIIRPKTVEFLEKYELSDEDVANIIHSLSESDYYLGPEEDTNPKYKHPFWIFVKFIKNIKVNVYIKIKIINHHRKVVVFSIHEEGNYEL